MRRVFRHVRRSPWLGCFGILVILLLAGFVTFKVYERGLEMKRIPRLLTVTGKIYEAEKAWGFGPGGNETGVSVYRLGDADAQRLTSIDATLLNDASIRAAVGRAGRDYGEWRRTPIARRRWGKSNFSEESQQPLRISEYLNHYGFGIPLDPAAEEMIDRTISAPGAFYAYGRGGSLIVIAPSVRRVIFAYAG